MGKKLKTLHRVISVFAVLMLINCGGRVAGQQTAVPAQVLSANTTPSFAQGDSTAPLTIPNYNDPIYVEKEDTLINYVTLKLDESKIKKVLPDFSIAVTVDVKYMDASGKPISLATGQVLTISYSNGAGKKYTPISCLRYGGHTNVYVKITNISLTTQSSALSINDLSSSGGADLIALSVNANVSRDFKFNCSSTVSNLTASSLTLPYDQFIVSWKPPTSADTVGLTAYDVEWAWVETNPGNNDSIDPNFVSNSNFLLSNIFQNNTTRVTIPVSNPSYAIPTLYDGTGYIFYRVRPLQVMLNEQVRPGTWSSVVTDSSIAKYKYYFSNKGHENNLNWQATTSFAEDGKRKTVIQYFDGTLRARQTVTKDNETQNTIIAQTMYDYQGRPAIQVLPTPTLGNLIAYAHNLNQFDGVVYGANHTDPKIAYDSSAGSCPTSAKNLLSVDTGTSNYYSSNNKELSSVYVAAHPNDYYTNIAKYIPDAGGFPFTETVYTPDNTGRIYKQGGVGTNYQIGGNHTTNYFYGSPDQQEIDGLFGIEAGNASHYFKNMVQDANGQFSVNYVDMHGHTVATALAGDSPNNLQGIASYHSAKNAIKLDTLNLLNPSTNTVADNTIVSNTTLLVPSQADYHFSYTLTPRELDALGCNGINFPYKSIYDLSITISSACQDYPLVIKGKATNMTGQKSFGFTFDPITLPTGEYNISKRLSVNADSFQAYKDSFYQRDIASSACLITQNGYINTATASIIASSHCDSNHHPLYPITPMSTLAMIHSQMLADVTPPFGQYAATGLNNSAYSIFIPSKINTSDSVYQLPTTPYFMPGTSTKDPLIYDASGNVTHDTAVFSTNFKQPWAAQLLCYHPEYNKLVYAEANLAASFSFDSLLLQTSYATAFANGWFNSTTTTTATVTNAFLLRDPFFSLAGTSSEKSTMLNTIESYQVYGSTAITLWQAAYSSMVCTGNSNAKTCAIASPINPYAWNSLPNNNAEFVWKMFKSQYLAEKLTLVEKFLDALSSLTIKNHNLEGDISQYSTINIQNGIARSIRFGTTDQSNPSSPLYNTLFNSANLVNNTATANALVSQANDSVSQNFDSCCTANIPAWDTTLSHCPQIQGIADLTTRANLINAIVYGDASTSNVGFLKICETSANSTNPFGASTSPSLSGINSNSAVLAKVLLEYGVNVDGFCNAYIFDNVRPATSQLGFGNQPILQTTDCICNKISAIVDSIETNHASAFIPIVAFSATMPHKSVSPNKRRESASFSNGIDTMSLLVQYMQSDYNTTIADTTLQALMQSCAGSNQMQAPCTGTTYTCQYELFDDNCNERWINTAYTNLQSQTLNSTEITLINSSAQLAIMAYATLGITYTTVCDGGNPPPNYRFLPNCTYTTTTYLNPPVSLPPFLQCGTASPCIGCAIYKNYKAGFVAEFGTLNGDDTIYNKAPYSNIPASDTNITNSKMHANQLFAQYMNAQTGFNKSWVDYVTFDNTCSSGKDSTICGQSPFATVPNPVDTSCCGVEDSTLGVFGGIEQYKYYVQHKAANFDTAYLNTCLRLSSSDESFTVSFAAVSQYHYTLYYYDQAGNLIKTVPPAGVNANFSSSFLKQVAADRASGATNSSDIITHSLVTQYRYNTLNQVVEQVTPDGGFSQFWYDRLGRLVVSQNAKQANPPSGGVGAYSYTLYDQLGRITEVGEKQQATAMTQAISQNDASLYAWVTDAATYRRQITRTVYDYARGALCGSTFNSSALCQQNLRNRVSYTLVIDSEASAPPVFPNITQGGTWAFATFFSYDAHGNVSSLLHDYTEGGMAAKNEFKRTDYYYDLISGKVNNVSYQTGYPDAFYHQYCYDAENRLISVYTSFDSSHWDNDAQYQYYRHGPLARTLLGQNNVQGIDYAYTLQGWLKGVNATPLGTSDMGGDGYISTQNTNVARDAYGYSLHYFSGDYAAIGGANPFADVATGLNSFTTNTFNGLYNGNIASMAVDIPKLSPSGGGGLVYNYGYDQLNRIVAMDAFTGLASGTLSHTDDYKERVAYDANGNIQGYFRNGTTLWGNALAMDSLTYKYTGGTNRLDHIHDNVLASNYTTDVDSQDTLNYAYDPIGNLTKDAQGGVTKVEWTVYGKIWKLTKANGTVVKYTYDAAGNRISKLVTNHAGTKETWYVRDAQGNVLSVYEKAVGGDLIQAEVDLYGSSRLGVYNRNVDVDVMPVITNYATFERGDKFFELTNHLGNVLATITDRTVLHSTDGTNIDYQNADVATATDYYPFGMAMPGRNGKAATGGGWAGGTTVVNGVSVPTDLTVSARTNNTPLEYKAANSVNLVDGFESGSNDEFDAVIADATNTGGGTSTGNTGNGTGSSTSEVSAYRYGFNGKEMDNDIENAVQDYGMRIYDGRLGRFLSVDPLTKKFAGLTTYQFASNSPIENSDLDGAEALSEIKAGLARQMEMTIKIPTLQKVNKKIEDARFSAMMQNAAQIPSAKVTNAIQYSQADQEKHDAMCGKFRADHGQNPDGTPMAWAELAENKHFKGFADNVGSRTVTLATLSIGGVEFKEAIEAGKALNVIHKGLSFTASLDDETNISSNLGFSEKTKSYIENGKALIGLANIKEGLHDLPKTKTKLGAVKTGYNLANDSKSVSNTAIEDIEKVKKNEKQKE